MKDIKSYLKDWIKIYLENRDIILNNIQEIKDVDKGIKVVYTDKIHIYIFDLPDFDNLDKGYITYVLLNNKQNLALIIKNWTKLKKMQNLSIFFLNPFSSMDKKWIIYPYTHSKIIEGDKHLKKSLAAISQNVDTISEEEFIKQIS